MHAVNARPVLVEVKHEGVDYLFNEKTDEIFTMDREPFGKWDEESGRIVPWEGEAGVFGEGGDPYGVLTVLLNNVNVKSALDEKDNNGLTALMYAALKRDPKITEMLLEAGADRNILYNKKTAYDLAVKNDNHRVAKLLED